MAQDTATQTQLSPEFHRELASEYLVNAKYARLKDDGKRESYEEIIDRIIGMHREHYGPLVDDFGAVENLLQEIRPTLVGKVVLPSARMMQFAGKYNLANHIRGYNCSFTHIDQLKKFSELLLVLLAGCGVGFSVQRRHIDKLPTLKMPNESNPMTFVIPDTIEGWADSVRFLVDSYKHTAGQESVAVVFDYSLIRPKGTYLASSQGHAPGHEPLQKAHENIRAIMKNAANKNPVGDGAFRLRDIDCHDICCALSEPVVDGGSRRAAMISMFDNDSEDMLQCKRGAEGIDYPSWRTLANNSAVLVRHECTEDDVLRVINGGMTRTGDGELDFYHTGDPGIIFVGNRDEGANPCQPAWAPILTRKGVSTMGEVQEGDEIWSQDGWVKVVKKWSTGVKDVYRYRTTASVFYGTENHRIVQNGEKIEVKEAQSIDPLRGSLVDDLAVIALNPQDIVDGLVLGDGTAHKANNGMPFLTIGKNDQCYFDPESGVSHLIGKQYGGETSSAYKVETTIKPHELPRMWDRKIPERFMRDPTRLRGLLRGLYSANGSVVSTRVTLKTTSKQLCEDVQIALSSLGIASYYTTNKPTDVQFINGTYTCRKSYDINISTDRDLFRKLIGFVHPYKSAHLDDICKSGTVRREKSYDIIEVEHVSTEEVFDITVDGPSHTYWTTGSNVSNCVEIGLNPIHPTTGESGWQFCNLSEIIAPTASMSREAFLSACRVAAIVGTLQAGYTDFPYLGRVTEEIVRNEALLGVSMTGIFECLDRLTPELLREGAAVVVATNAEVAKILGINPAARMTCVKPAGSTSWIGKTVSQGANPPPAKRYLRRFLADVDDPAFQAWRDKNPNAVQPHPKNKAQAYVIHRIENHEAITIDEVFAQEHLDVIKMIRKNWVDEGRVLSRCTMPTISHNVSNTVTLRKHEYKDFAKRLFEDREYFGGVAFFEYFNAKTTKENRTLQNRPAFPMEPVDEDDPLWIACADSKAPDYSDDKYARAKETRNFTADSACAGGACNV